MRDAFFFLHTTKHRRRRFSFESHARAPAATAYSILRHAVRPVSVPILFEFERLLLSEGYQPDVIYTSRLKRAVKSTWTILNALDAPYLPVYKSWRLNERNYGALTGLKKVDAARELGAGVVQAW